MKDMGKRVPAAIVVQLAEKLESWRAFLQKCRNKKGAVFLLENEQKNQRNLRKGRGDLARIGEGNSAMDS